MAIPVRIDNRMGHATKTILRAHVKSWGFHPSPTRAFDARAGMSVLLDAMWCNQLR